MPLITTVTSSTRPALNTSHRGTILFETDTNRMIVWSGAEWVVYMPDASVDPLFLNSRSAFIYYDRNRSSENDHVGLKIPTAAPFISRNSARQELSFSMWFCSMMNIPEGDSSTSGLGAIAGGGSGANRAWFGPTTRNGFFIQMTDAQGSYFTRNSANLYVNNNGKYTLPLHETLADGVSTFQTPKTLNDGNWHHVALSMKRVQEDDEIPSLYQGNRVFRVWIDGQACPNGASGKYIATDSKEFTYTNGVFDINSGITATGFSFGAYPNSTSSDGFAGWIDEVGIYNKMLTSEQVAEIYAGGAVANLRDKHSDMLMHYYRMGDSDGVVRENKELITTTSDSIPFDETTGFGGMDLVGWKQYSGQTHERMVPELAGPIFTNFAVGPDGQTSIPFPDAKEEYEDG